MIKLIGLFVACACAVCAQEPASALKAARELAAIVKTGDTVWMVDKMYPEVRKTLAANHRNGDRELIEQYRALGEQMKQAGVVYESFTVSDPVGVYLVKDKTETIVILPTKLVMSMKMPNGKTQRIEQQSFLYAIARASDKDKWYFLSGSYSLNGMRSLFYDFPLSVEKTLPPIKNIPLE